MEHFFKYVVIAMMVGYIAGLLITYLVPGMLVQEYNTGIKVIQLFPCPYCVNANYLPGAIFLPIYPLANLLGVFGFWGGFIFYFIKRNNAK